jgi:hypothetical protein
MPPPRPGAARMAGAAAMTPLGWGSGSARATAKTTMATKANKNSLNMLNRFLTRRWKRFDIDPSENSLFIGKPTMMQFLCMSCQRQSQP